MKAEEIKRPKVYNTRNNAIIFNTKNLVKLEDYESLESQLKEEREKALIENNDLHIELALLRDKNKELKKRMAELYQKLK